MTSVSRTQIAELNAEKVTEERVPPWRQNLRNLRHNKSAAIGFTLLMGMLLMGIFAPLIATHDPRQVLINVPGYEGISKGDGPCIPAFNYLGCGDLAVNVKALSSANVQIITAGDSISPEDLVFNDGQARFLEWDLSAGPNTIHIIDGVMIPPAEASYSFNVTAQSFAPPLMLNVLETRDEGEFSILQTILLEDETYEELSRKIASSIPFTLLAPTDAAFETYFEEQGITQAEFLDTPQLVEELMTYHILSGRKSGERLAEQGAVQHNLHIMGVDLNLRDEFSRVVYGVRTSLPVGIAAVSIAIVVGTTIGLVSGYAGGWVDNAMMRVMDVLLAFPSLLLAIAIVTILGPGLLNALIAIAIVSIPQYARIVRSQVLSVKEEEFVTANRALGAGPLRVLFLQILPNSITPIVVQGTLGVGTAILDAAALSFLGLGAQPPTPEWGLMLSEARQDFRTFPHLMFFPGAAIMITVLGFNLLGDGIRDVLDPRLNRR